MDVFVYHLYGPQLGDLLDAVAEDLREYPDQRRLVNVMYDDLAKKYCAFIEVRYSTSETGLHMDVMDRKRERESDLRS